MPDLIDFFEAADDPQGLEISELRLRGESVMALVFTSESVVCRLHYEQDESVRSYLLCPGDRCPYCHLGDTPTEYLLLPVYNVEEQEIQVLRVSSRRGPGSLGTALLPYLKDPEIADKVLLIRRIGMRYRVEARPLAEGAGRGERVIQSFVDACPDLRTAFPAMTPEEMAETPRLARKLDVIGGLPKAKPEAKEGDG